MRVVSPTPAALPNEYPRLHVLLECNRPRTSPRRATLLSFQDLQPDGPSPVITWIPFLAPPVLTLQIIADIAIQPCDSRHLVVLAGTPDRRWMTEQDERNVQHGLYLPVLRDIRRRFPTQRLEIDENAMMQSRDIRGSSRSPRRSEGITPSSTHSSSSTLLAHVFRNSREHRLLTFDRTSDGSYAEQVTSAWSVPAHQNVIDLHIVNSPPRDLEISADSTYIAEFSADRQRQADPSDRLVLVDVTFTSADGLSTAANLRRTLWGRGFMSRVDVLHLLSSSSLCRLTTISCTVHLNHRLWPPDDSAHRQMMHGDYLHLVITGPAGVPTSHVQLAACERESADRQRYIYQQSPSPSPDRNTPVLANAESEEEEDDGETSVSLLQKTASIQHAQVPTREHHPDEPVDPHVVDLWCGKQVSLEDVPTSRVLLTLADLIPEPARTHHTRSNAQQGTDTVVRLAWIARTDRIDDLNLELPREEAPHDAIDELKMWGITSPVHRLDLDWCAADYLVLDAVGNDIPLCIYTQGQAEISVLSCRQGPSDDDICHMSRLCTFGFGRAVILHKYRVSSEIQLIHFINSATGGFEPKPPVETPAMPPQLPRRANGPVQHRIAFHNLTTSDHNISLPLSREEIVSIFGSGSNTLSTEVSHLSLTTAQIEQIECLPKHPPTSTLDSFDRLLIFVDGSSNPTHKHHDIQFVNEFGSSDAWAFAVLGERYNDKEAPLTFVGWTSQTVCYEVGAPCFTGVDRVGADVAEREALLWAGLWRISVDMNVPTTFCYDSKVAGHFAEGQFGTLNPTPQHRLLRGTFPSPTQPPRTRISPDVSCLRTPWLTLE